MKEILEKLKRILELLQNRNDNEEVWLETNAFLAQFGMFTKDWLEHYGWKLPRERAEVTEDNGNKRVTRWAYPRNEIQRMIRNRELVNL
jgi:hypothetical protein